MLVVAKRQNKKGTVSCCTFLALLLCHYWSLVFLGTMTAALCFQTCRNLLVKAAQGIAFWIRAHSSWLALLFLTLLCISIIRDWNTGLGLLCAIMMTAGRHMVDLQFHSGYCKELSVDVDRAVDRTDHTFMASGTMLVVILVS